MAAVIAPRLEWHLPEPIVDPPRFAGFTAPVATLLARRGFQTDDEVGRFLAAGAETMHPIALMADAEAALDRIDLAIAAGEQIAIWGDYDADGISAIAVWVRGLRALGIEPEPYVPSRLSEGYGLSRVGLEALAERGVRLVVTCDCGIANVAEVEIARSLGLDVIVTDHHRPGETLPDCPIVATRPSNYPFPELCGTGVVFKLAQALGAANLERHFDVVALATVADVVPLVDENRGLVAGGLKRLARTTKPGLRALMASAHVDPAVVDAGAIAFRLAPRINAAGRLGHPKAALDLLLTEDAQEATRLAAMLESLNRDRQSVEERILREALEQVEQWPESKRRRRGYVVAGEDWHRGVIGIVASRLVERFHRPVVLIAGGEDGWTGSGRSIPAFDLHGALGACSAHLERWGGHRAAAGLSIDEENVEAFAEAFGVHADGVLDEADLVPSTHVDAVVRGTDLTLSLCEELEALAPFGLGNPGVTLLAVGCEISALGAVGDGKHLKLAVTHEGARSGAIAFGQGGQLDRYRRPLHYDVAFKLQANQWNGTVSPQLVVKRIFDTPDRYAELRKWLAEQWVAAPDARAPEAAAIFAELELVDEQAGRRHLVESPTFLEILREPLPLAA